MRKFAITTILDRNTFQTTQTIMERDDAGVITELYSGPSLDVYPKYTAAQLGKIDAVNSVLATKGEAPLTEAEIQFLIDPMHDASAEKLKAEDLQRLAGFTVEKKIVYLDKQS
jgi:hypothetical protein